MKKKDVVQHLITFIFKYIWILCIILISLETVSTIYTAELLMKQSSSSLINATAEELSSRVHDVEILLNSLAQDSRINDTEADLYDRTIVTRPYAENFDLFMIALCDKDANIISSNELQRPNDVTNMLHRDYIRKLYSTGETQVTDAFVAGIDNVTKNYTIAVPIKKGDTVEGCVLGSIYFDEIQGILSRDLFDKNTKVQLLGSDHKVMESTDQNNIGVDYKSIVKKSWFSNVSANKVHHDLEKSKSGNLYMLENGILYYVLYKDVPNTPWTIVYQVGYTSIFTTLIPMVLLKNIFYIILSVIISILGRKYLKKNLSEVNQLVKKVSEMQEEVWQSKTKSYQEILDLTSQGLSDQLTGLPTRVVLFDMLNEIDFNDTKGAILFVDLDDLKYINDTFGHDQGDVALVHIASIIKSFMDEHLRVIGRYGGDEFIVLIEDVDENEVKVYAQQILNKIKKTIQCDNKDFEMHVSIGISLYPIHGNTKEELIKKADEALYDAKLQGKNKIALYKKTK